MSDCIEYQGKRNPAGYGRVLVNGKNVGAHRLAYRLFVGPLSDWEIVRHTCDNPPCINPEHLRVGTQSDNLLDAVERGRHGQTMKTHCKWGHPFDEENTYVHIRNGVKHRQCRTCKRQHRKPAEVR